MSLLKAAVFVAALCASSPVLAEEMPKPLGIPLGSSVEEVRKGLSIPLHEKGPNRFTGGPMYTGAGEGLGIEGLQSIFLVFDKDLHLAGLSMTMGKDSFERVFGHLKKQYPLKSSKVPFVGDKEAIFETKAARIEISAPHLSFSMEVGYMTKSFYQTIATTLENDQKIKNERESGKF